MTDESIVITGIQRRVIWLEGTLTQEYEIAPSIGPSGVQDDPVTVRWERDENYGPPFDTPRPNTIASFRCEPKQANGHWVMTATLPEPTPRAHADELTARLNFASAPEHQSDRLVRPRDVEVPCRREGVDPSELVLRLVRKSMDSSWKARSPLVRHPRYHTIFDLPDAGAICSQRRAITVRTSGGKLVVKPFGGSKLQEQFVEELLEPVAMDMGLLVEWVTDERLVPDVQRQPPLDLGAAGYAWPQYRNARDGELPDLLFDGYFWTKPQPVPWIGGRLMYFELWPHVIDPKLGGTKLETIRDSIARFLAADSTLLDQVTQRVFDDCVQCMHDVDYGDPLPFTPPTEPADVWNMKEFQMADQLHITVGSDGAALIGLDLTPPWEEEHGFDLFFDGATPRGAGRSGDMYQKFDQ